MNKLNKIGLLLICLFLTGLVVSGQTLERATAGYKTFVRMNSESGDKGVAYNQLYQCYKDYLSVLNASAKGSAAYLQAKNTLRDIRPYLQNGAVHHSQKGNSPNALLFAQAYVDIPLLQDFAGEAFVQDSYYPTMVYFAASGSYNSRDYAKAIIYFKEYLKIGATEKRQDVFVFMAKASINLKDYSSAQKTLKEAVSNYPSDFNLLSMAINCCIDSGDNEELQNYLTRALASRPGDDTLLNIQGKLYEDTQNYQKALNVYTTLRSKYPRSLETARHLGLNYYNLGVMYANKSAIEKVPQSVRQYTDRAKEYFKSAIPIFLDVLAADPASLKYLEALAVAYSYTDDKEQLLAVNDKIARMGGSRISDSAIPSLMAYAGSKNVQVVVKSGDDVSAMEQYPTDDVVTSMQEIPSYSVYAKKYVEDRLKNWQTKDAYETVDEYKLRVTEKMRDAKVKELLREAEADYIRIYSRDIRFANMQLKPYDAENRVFLVESQFGEIIVSVPRENNEARVFESNWAGMQFKEPKFYIDNDRLALSGLTFVTPIGQSYRYDNQSALNYTETRVDLQFGALDQELFAQTGVGDAKSSRVQKNEIRIGSSDVDLNIPKTKVNNDKTFAVIIANENYEIVTKVPMALNDGKTFGTYCERTLGMPKNNIRFYPDASYGTMLRAVNDIKGISDAYAGDIQVVFYYAGHGIPDEATKDAFLLPIDADGAHVEGCYPLNKLYGELGRLNARSVVVFLDACFSGAKRDGGMLASARGVALKAKKEAPQGNMVIFSAASDDETAFPYEEKGHGLFTYFLLKKLQESKGDASLSELGDYITTQVRQQSVVVNRKTQTPTVFPSMSVADTWQKLRLKP